MLADFVTSSSIVPSMSEIRSLATFRAPDSCAVSFFFGQQSHADRSHRAETIAIDRLIQKLPELTRRRLRSQGIIDEIHAIVAASGEVTHKSRGWRAVYANHTTNFFRNVFLPAPITSSELHVESSFRIVPLLKAIQACRPYEVVLLESGKARLFEVAGTDIEEKHADLPMLVFERRSQDNRVGWSKHLDGNIEHRERAWYSKLADVLSKRYPPDGPAKLVVGCRKDLRGELHEYFQPLHPVLMGWFTFTSFAGPADDVLHRAMPVFAEYERTRCERILRTAGDTNAGGRELKQVLEYLSYGKVQKLLIGQLGDQQLAICAECTSVQIPAGTRCGRCSTSRLDRVPAEEALVRLALAHDAEVIIFPEALMNRFEGVSALLRR